MWPIHIWVLHLTSIKNARIGTKYLIYLKQANGHQSKPGMLLTSKRFKLNTATRYKINLQTQYSVKMNYAPRVRYDMSNQIS